MTLVLVLACSEPTDSGVELGDCGGHPELSDTLFTLARLECERNDECFGASIDDPNNDDCVVQFASGIYQIWLDHPDVYCVDYCALKESIETYPSLTCQEGSWDLRENVLYDCSERNFPSSSTPYPGDE